MARKRLHGLNIGGNGDLRLVLDVLISQLADHLQDQRLKLPLQFLLSGSIQLRGKPQTLDCPSRKKFLAQVRCIHGHVPFRSTCLSQSGESATPGVATRKEPAYASSAPASQSRSLYLNLHARRGMLRMINLGSNLTCVPSKRNSYGCHWDQLKIMGYTVTALRSEWRILAANIGHAYAALRQLIGHETCNLAR